MFSIEYWYRPQSTKNPGSKISFHLGDKGDDIGPKWGKLLRKKSKFRHFQFSYFFKKTKKKLDLEKYFSIFPDFIEIFFSKKSLKRNNENWKFRNFGNVRKSFPPFFDQCPAFGWIVLQHGMIFFDPGFYVLRSLYQYSMEKLCGDQCGDKYFCRIIFHFFVTHSSEDRFHLPGERDVQVPFIWWLFDTIRGIIVKKPPLFQIREKQGGFLMKMPDPKNSPPAGG